MHLFARPVSILNNEISVQNWQSGCGFNGKHMHIHTGLTLLSRMRELKEMFYNSVLFLMFNCETGSRTRQFAAPVSETVIRLIKAAVSLWGT